MSLKTVEQTQMAHSRFEQYELISIPFEIA